VEGSTSDVLLIYIGGLSGYLPFVLLFDADTIFHVTYTTHIGYRQIDIKMFEAIRRKRKYISQKGLYL